MDTNLTFHISMWHHCIAIVGIGFMAQDYYVNVDCGQRNLCVIIYPYNIIENTSLHILNKLVCKLESMENSPTSFCKYMLIITIYICSMRSSISCIFTSQVGFKLT